jgi:RimJ/RimL family protein N-acetyltransferase
MSKPILRSFPDKIETERLYIRPCLPGDGEVVHRAIVKSQANMRRWLPFAENDQTVEEVEAGVRESYAKFIKREDFRLHIYRKEDHEFIGSTGLHRIVWDVPKVEIGYWIHRDHSGNGYMTEAVKGLTTFAIEELKVNRVEIRCDELNLASRKIPEKLGFVLEGILRNDDLGEGRKELRNTCVYSVLPSDWTSSFID